MPNTHHWTTPSQRCHLSLRSTDSDYFETSGPATGITGDFVGFFGRQEIGKVLVKLPGQLAKAPMSGSYDALCLAVMLGRNLQKDPRS